MTKLSVNINKFATLRNSRGGNNPDVIKAAMDAERFGADGVTVHPRPDERHIRYDDTRAIRKIITTEFNIEGNPTEQKFVDLGWDTIKYQSYLIDIISVFKKAGIRVSIFVDPVIAMVEGAALTGTDRIELYTEGYAKTFASGNHAAAVVPYVAAAEKAKALGLGINAGHDLDLSNLKYLKQHIPYLDEVSIGHALVCDAIYLGYENTVQMYKRQLI
jgi:pyridoxine 5-phosphate synthase